ncbi:unnamed protein product [Phytomonas sp. EM1]|nr:unnamed protein product [Phytomonas sp. EM1]|eukprot:CCW63898.1 unnamed protein product [Phytomonas sp. isolate EM1]
MGKLTICVHKCDLLRSFQYPNTNLRVVISVDNTYRFQTRVVNGTHSPVYEETFSVGNTHHLAKIEVSVWHVMKTKVIDLNSALNTLGIGNAIGISNNDATSKGLGDNSAGHFAAANPAGEVGGNVLLGRCHLSIQRLTKGQRKTRAYVLGTLPKKKDVAWIEDPVGVAGAITITLHSDTLGESPEVLNINEQLEVSYIQRLKRLLLRYDPKKIPVLDIILSNVRDPSELGEGVVPIKPKAQLLATSSARYSSLREGSTSTRISDLEDPSLNVSHPDEYESFSELMRRLCRAYHGEEPDKFSVSVNVSGCSHLDRSVMDKSLSSSANVYVILRTSSQDFVTEEVKLHSTISWPMNACVFDIIDLDSFTLFVVVMGRVGSKFYQVGHAKLGLLGLLRERVSARNMYLCFFSGSNSRAVVGRVHIFLEPLNFGETPLNIAKCIDEYYDRLGIFLKQYDLMLLSKMDMFIRGRAGRLEDFMNELIMLYGYEPNTAQLQVTVNSIVALHESPTIELNKKRVVVVVTMGGVSFRTKSHEVRRFTETRFGEDHIFNVVRETDYIRVDVVKASDEKVVYGSVEFSCLNMQCGMPSTRRLYLVGNCGKPNAYFTGIITITLFSDDIGCSYKVDEDLDDMYTGRLRRYAERYFPESLHCVNLATAAIFDMESFMAELSVTHTKEAPTYAVFMTILGCRQLPSGFSGISPYVVVRLGIDSYSTRWIKDSTEPDYFEFTEFYCDQLSEKCITLVVMDHSDMGHDREVGYVVLSLEHVKLGQLYHDFEPLQPFKKSRKEGDPDVHKGPSAVHHHYATNSSCSGSIDKKKSIGSVGFKFSVVNLKYVDQTRAQVIRREYFHHHSDPTNPVLDVDSLQQLESGSNNGRPLGSSDAASADGGNPRGAGASPIRLFRSAAMNLRFIGKVRKFVMRRSVEFVEHFQRNVRLSNDSSLSQSSSETLEVGEPVLAAKCPTFNIMDRFYALFGHHFMLDSNTSNGVDSELEVSADHPQVVSKFSNVGSTPLGEAGGMVLHVRVLFCKNLIQTSSRWLNPYLLLFTASESHRTQMDFETPNPVYAEEFTFRVLDPYEDFLQLYVLTDTPYGVKRLGHCVLSLCNVRRGQPHTRRASLVVDSNTPNAFEHGSVYVLLMGENFGLQYLPSADAENRLREQIHGYLVHAAPSQLHWLEWFVGTYADLNKSVLPRLFGKHYLVNKSKQAAVVKVGIRTLTKLSLNGIYASGNCAVKVKVGSKTYAETRVAVGVDGHFQVDQTLEIKLENIETVILRIVVIINGKIKGGECWVNLADLHRGIVQERTHMLVQNVRGPNPAPCGLITISLLSHDFGSYSEPPSKQEEAVYTRLQRYLSYYKPFELINADIIFSSVFNPNAYMRKLIDTYGPDPGDFPLRVVIKRCMNLYFSSHGNGIGGDASPGRSRTSINPFCLLRCGLDEYRTRISEGKGEWIFNESFTVHVGLPELEVIELIVFDFYASKNIEIGRTRVFIDKLKRGIINSRKLLLVSNAGTKSAVVNGIVELDLFSNAIGAPAYRSQSGASSPSYARLASLSLGGSSDPTETTTRVHGVRPDPRYSSSERDLPRFSPLTHPKEAEGEKEKEKEEEGGGGGGSSRSERVPQPRYLDDALRLPLHASPHTPASDTRSVSSVFEEADIYQVPHFFSPVGAEMGAGSPNASLAPAMNPAELADRPVEVTIVGFTFTSVGVVPTGRELYVRVVDGQGVLFRTEPMPLARLVRLGRGFPVPHVVLRPDVILTMKLGVRGAFANTPLCYTDFCFNDCHRGLNVKHLRLYDPHHRFVGAALLKIGVPDLPLPPSWAPRRVAAASLELITDDIASLGERYSPQSLQGLDPTLSRALDLRRLHHTLRRKLAPDVLATVYVLIHAVDLDDGERPREGGEEGGDPGCVVAVEVGGDAVETARQLPAAHGGQRVSFFPYGMSRAETRTLVFCPIRVDLPATEFAAPMTIRVREGKGKAEGGRKSGGKGIEIGRAVVSPHALLTPEVFDLFERVRVPLVRVKQAANCVQTRPVGSLVFSIAPAAYERYVPPVCYPGEVVRGFSRPYVRYYERRIMEFMRHYNVGELVGLHAHLYDTYVGRGNWREGLPEYLSELVEQWGEEVLPSEPVPPPD